MKLSKFIEEHRPGFFWLTMAILCYMLFVTEKWPAFITAVISLATIFFLIILDRFRNPEIYRKKELPLE